MIGSRQAVVTLSILLLLAVNIGNLKASAAVPLPGNVDPGAIVHKNPLANYNNETTSSEKDTNFEMKDASTAESPAVLYNDKILVKNVVFKGNTKIKTEILQELASDIAGQEVSMNEIKKLTSKITKLYRDKGYLTSIAYVAPQEMDNDTLEITILEGKVGNINIQGTKWAKPSYIKNNILKVNNISEDKIFNVNSLRESLNDLNSTNSLKGQIILQKGEKPATTDIVLDIKERTPLKLGVSWDNLGRDLVGVQRGNATISDTNLTGFGDTLYTGVSRASGTLGFNSGYSIPVGPYGTIFNLGYSYSKVKLGDSYKSLDIKGKSQLFSPSIIQPLYKGNNFSLTSNLTFDMRFSRTTMMDSTELQDYKLSVLRYGITGIKNDRSGRWISKEEISAGLPVLGSKAESAYGVGSTKFIKANAYLTRIQNLPFNSVGIFRLGGQYSPDAMLAPEQIQMGGMYSVRGYKEGLLLGDVGCNASLEVRKTIPHLPNLNIPYWQGKSLRVPLKDRIQFATFYDFGYAKAIHQQNIEQTSKYLSGAGIGLRINLTKYLMVNVDLGVPLVKRQALNQNSMKLHFGFSSDLI